MMEKFLLDAARVAPSPRQKRWLDIGFYAFVHFGVNTFTDREWGDGTEAESLFNPTDLDCGQWVEAIQAAGMKGLILTAKHHDGFCLWPSTYTEHSVKNSPFQGDVVKLASEACARAGIPFGFYLSPWDRNSPLYGTPAYNDYFCNQLTELLTGYGEIFCVWFDNACGEGPTGKKQVYDFPRYFDLIRKYQPNAVIFNDYGPDVRWCGNEAGAPRQAEWAVVPTELCPHAQVQTGPGPLAERGDLSALYNTDPFIGTQPQIFYSKGLAFCPCEFDMSIRPGWFWHESEEPHSLDRLFHTYLTSVGANAGFNLNVPPNRQGRIDERDVQRLRELGQRLRQAFGTPLPLRVRRVDAGDRWQGEWELTFPEGTPPVRTLELREDLDRGQRIESFKIVCEESGGTNFPLCQGATVGNRRLCRLENPFALQNPLTDDSTGRMRRLRLLVTASRGVPDLAAICAYGDGGEA